MFFIMGVSQGQKKLNFDQLIVCGRCGRYGHLEVYMVYSYLSLFFIPVLKWGRRYYVRTTCCNASVEHGCRAGKKIQRGEITSLPRRISFQTVRQCSRAGESAALPADLRQKRITSSVRNAAGSFKERVTETAPLFPETEQYRLPSAGDWRRALRLREWLL